jgi:hypothetical protein
LRAALTVVEAESSERGSEGGVVGGVVGLKRGPRKKPGAQQRVKTELKTDNGVGLERVLLRRREILVRSWVHESRVATFQEVVLPDGIDRADLIESRRRVVMSVNSGM